ncbi:MAG: D-alanine-D-alanine [Planctomycetota bacterium]|nr:MAG: D-alanine-D-alanine [Planctomycetota bacterium]
MRVGIVHTAGSACRCHVALRGAATGLGHAAVVVPCEKIDAARQRLAACDLVFEHADTFRGSHEARPRLRFMLERWGCRLAGAPAAAAAVADDKAAAHRVMEAAGVPMARWRLWRGGGAGLGFPVVVKRPLAHGSADLRLIQGAAEWGKAAIKFPRPALVEEFVEGRELAVAGYEVRGRISWLPVVEISVSSRGVYSRGLKVGARNPKKKQARLPAARLRELRRLAARAWRALGLRHYARFDVRLGAEGRFRFLEANVRPSLEPGSELMLAAKWAGLTSEKLIGRFIAAALSTAGRNSGKR